MVNVIVHFHYCSNYTQKFNEQDICFETKLNEIAQKHNISNFLKKSPIVYFFPRFHMNSQSF